jgi:hypothetical protein
MISFMLEGGLFTWVVFGLLIVGGLMTLVRVVLARYVDFPGAGLCLTGLLVGLGLIGTMQGWRLALEAVAFASAETKLALMQAGVDVGWNPTTLALIGAVVFAPLNGIALARSRNRATGVIKALGWGCGTLAALSALLGWAVAVWLSGVLLTLGGGAEGVAVEAVVQAKTIEIGLLAGMFTGMLSSLLGLGGGLTLLVAGATSGIRNRKKHMGEDADGDL